MISGNFTVVESRKTLSKCVKISAYKTVAVPHTTIDLHPIRAVRMWLRIIPIVVLTVQLHGAVDGCLPLVPGNVLSTEKTINGSKTIDCRVGQQIVADFERQSTFNLSQALTQPNFKPYTFSSRGVTLKKPVIEKFSFAKVAYRPWFQRERSAFVLQVDPEGEPAYWLPQGGAPLDVPRAPRPGQPTRVFTADFSGCSWTVTPTDHGTLRLRHVQGSPVQHDREFNNLTAEDRGGNVTYALQPHEYGYVFKGGRLIDHSTAYAYMQYAQGLWTMHVQHQTCAPTPGMPVYDQNGQIKTIKMNYFNQKSYDDITITDFFRIR